MDQAKNIFYNCLGNKSFMAREGMLEKYNAHNISQEQENKWCIEKLDFLEKELVNIREYNNLRSLLFEYKWYAKIIDKKRYIVFVQNLYKQKSNNFGPFTSIRIIEDIFEVFDGIENVSDNYGNVSKYFIAELKKIYERYFSGCLVDIDIPDRPSGMKKEEICERLQNDIKQYSKQYGL